MYDAAVVLDYGYGGLPRPWEIVAFSHKPKPLPSELISHIGRLFDLRPDIGSLQIKTEQGAFLVSRSLSDRVLNEAEEVLARIESVPGVQGVELYCQSSGIPRGSR